MGETVSLKELMAIVRKLDLKEQYTYRKYIALALETQANEYERRLKTLNNEGSRIAAAVAANVSSDTWAGFLKQYKEDNDRTLARFDKIEGFQNKLLGMSALAVFIVPILTGVVIALLT